MAQQFFDGIGEVEVRPVVVWVKGFNRQLKDDVLWPSILSKITIKSQRAVHYERCHGDRDVAGFQMSVLFDDEGVNSRKRGGIAINHDLAVHILLGVRIVGDLQIWIGKSTKETGR